MSRLTGLSISCAAAIAIGCAAPAAGAVVGACHVSPVVADLDRSMRFYRDLLGLDVSAAPAAGPGLRYFTARVPGMRCGVEPVEFDTVDRQPVRLRMQDPGAVTLILLVRDIDAAFARLKAAGVAVVTTGGAPVAPSPTSKTRAVIVTDPDGHFVELAELDPQPATTVAASSNVFDIRFRVTVSDLDQALQYYRERLGMSAKPGSFASGQGVMAMMGLPETAEYRLSMTAIPGSTLILEFLELKGLERAVVRPRAHDPGAYRLQLHVDDIAAPGAVLSDPNNLYLVLQRGPLP
jgi:catechol 2,3-dioxygenase-like lactoylglutathione lyase family enzyme